MWERGMREESKGREVAYGGGRAAAATVGRPAAPYDEAKPAREGEVGGVLVLSVFLETDLELDWLISTQLKFSDIWLANFN